MKSIRIFLNTFIRSIHYFLIPRALRKSIVLAWISVEEFAYPREVAGWLLGIHNVGGTAIDSIGMRWGNGVHIKHQIMGGIHSFFYERIISKSFYVIILSSVLEHMEHRTEFLKYLTNRFNPAKTLIRVPTFEQHYFKALKRELGLYAFVDATHVLEYSPEVFAAEMMQAALRINHLEIRWGDIWAECVPNV